MLTSIDIFLVSCTVGFVPIFNIPLNECLSDWHNLIGYVGQSVYFTDSTIEKNLFMNSRSGIHFQKNIDQVFDIVGINNFLDNSNLNFQSRVGEQGRLLSRGQRQRVGLARILLSKPKVLFLDEATNGLEYKSEYQVYKNLRKIKDLTVIAIIHSQSLDNCFDLIINL